MKKTVMSRPLRWVSKIWVNIEKKKEAIKGRKLLISNFWGNVRVNKRIPEHLIAPLFNMI